VQLDSARELKQSLADTVLQNVVATVRTRSAFGTAARSMTTVETTSPRTFALGVAPKKNGKDFQLAVRVQHRALEGSPEIETIQRQARGEVDVRYIGAVGKRVVPWHQQRSRPLRIGGSIGHINVTAGTLGAFVRGRDDGTIFILSNNHVLANESRGKAGDAIVQPGRIDGGQEPDDVVGQLVKFVRLKKRGINPHDCALATINDGIETQMNELQGIGNLAGLGDAFLDEGTRVAKVGRTTGVTQGRVTAFELDNLVVGFDIGNLRFDNQVEIEDAETGPFSQGGDSGSLVVGEDRRAVALLFAGGDQGGANGQGLTYANPLRDVLEALQVDLVF
jgi:hypothetical protein